MTKYLLILAVIAVVYALVRSRSTPRATGTHTHRKTSTPKEMVACAHCGVHLPREDALPAGERFYCCAAHRDHGPV